MDEWIDSHSSTHKTSSSPSFATRKLAAPTPPTLETKKPKASGASKPRKRAAPPATVEHLPKRPKLESMQRFSTASEAELTKLSTPFVPKKTEDATAWSLRNFHCWLKNRNSQDQLEKCPENLLEEMDTKKLNYWLAVFLVETRKVTGESYPPTTLHSIMSGLLRYMQTVDPQRCPNFFARNNADFVTLQNTMDSVFRTLRKEGIGSEKKTAKPFSKEEEQQLWSSGVLGVQDPVSLQRAVFFSNGKSFCLRGGNEHRELKLSQLKREVGGYRYTENASKNRAGGLGQLKLQNKTVFIAAVHEAGERCHCYLLDLYISKLPRKAIETDLFYVRPLENVQLESQTWYTCVPVGRNKLYKMVNDMCTLAGILGRTNHSLRATGATELYNAGVPEKIIKERTGHRSLECLRMYERTSEKQQNAVSRVLSAQKETSFNVEMTKLAENTTNIATHSSVPVMNFHNCQVNINQYSHGSIVDSGASLNH